MRLGGELKMFLFLFLFFSTCQSVKSHIQLHRNTNFNDFQLRQLKNVTLKYFSDSHSLAVITEARNSHLTSQLLANLQLSLTLPVMLSTVSLKGELPSITWTHEAHHLLFILDINSEYFKTYLQTATQSKYFLQDAFTIFINPTNNNSNINNLLSHCWEYYHMTNAIVIGVDCNNNLFINTVLPTYTDKQCSLAESGHLTLMNFTQNLFPDKMLNMNQCFIELLVGNSPPYVATNVLDNGEVDIEGIYGDLLKIIASRMNVTYKIKEIKNDKTDLKLQFLVEDSDVLAVLVLPSIKLFTLFDSSRKFGETGMTFAVPKSTFYSNWSVVFRAFDIATWFCISITFLTASLTLKYIIKFLKQYDKKLQFLSIIWCPFSALIGNPPMNFDIQCISGRYLIILILFLGIVIDTIYHSSLFLEMTFPKRKPNLQTISDLLSSGLTLKTHPDIKRYFLDSERSDLISLASTFIDSDNFIRDFNDTAANESFHIGMIGETFVIHTLRRSFENGNNLVHIGEDHYLMKYYTTFYFKKRSMFTRRFDEIIDNVIQSGFVDKWYKKWVPPKVKYSDGKSKDEHIVLSLSHLVGGFIIYFIGLILSIMVFTYEFFSVQ